MTGTFPMPGPAGVDVSILVVNWNGAGFIRRCLESVFATVRRPHEVIVVDNASADDSVAILGELAAAHPSVRLVLNPGNYGFAHGNNQAYALARGAWIFLLNSDVALSEGALDGLIAHAVAHPVAGLVTCAQVDRHGRPQHFNRRWPGPFTAALVYSRLWRPVDKYLLGGAVKKRYRMEREDVTKVRRVDQAGAAVALLPRAAIEKAGGLFDEQFPLFFNDVDLCWRLAQAGYEVHALPITVLHDGGSSVRRLDAREREYHLRSGLFRFYRKHQPAWRNLLLRALLAPPGKPPERPVLTPPDAAP